MNTKGDYSWVKIKNYSSAVDKRLRDEFAMAALQGWLSSFGPGASLPADTPRLAKIIADYSYAMADAMLKARAEK